MTRLARWAGLVACLSSALAPAATIAATPAATRLLPVLDRVEGARAVTGYRASLAAFCRAPDGVPVATRTALGIGAGAAVGPLCADAAKSAKALASGSFLEAHADEVLLDVPSGLRRADGERTLLVMRRDPAGGDYRLARQMINGNSFEARARVGRAGRPDVLFLCRRTGNVGFYPGTCGFLGTGTFGAAGADAAGRALAAAADDELALSLVTACGPQALVGLGDIRLRNGRLLVPLIVEEVVLRPIGASEAAGGPLCTKKTIKSTARFVIAYQIDADGPRRLTPTPARVNDLFGVYRRE